MNSIILICQLIFYFQVSISENLTQFQVFEWRYVWPFALFWGWPNVSRGKGQIFLGNLFRKIRPSVHALLWTFSPITSQLHCFHLKATLSKMDFKAMCKNAKPEFRAPPEKEFENHLSLQACSRVITHTKTMNLSSNYRKSLLLWRKFLF